MICEHLRPLELELIASGIKENYRGQPWSNNSREWVYYNCVFTDLEKTILRFNMRSDIIKMHSHIGTHDGQEHGLFCEACLDGIMGQHPEIVKRNFIDIPAFE